MSDTPSFTDGKLHEKERSSRPTPERPFLSNPISPDFHAQLFKRLFSVDPSRFAPGVGSGGFMRNDITWSNKFSDAAWTKTGMTAYAGGTPNPWDGALTVEYIQEDSATSEHCVSRAHTVIGLPHTLFAIVQQSSTSNLYLHLKYVDSAAVTRQIVFHPASGHLTNFTGTLGVDCWCEMLPRTQGGTPQWFLVGFTFTPAGGAGTLKMGLSHDGSTTSYAGSFSALGVAQVQLEFTADAPHMLCITGAVARSGTTVPSTDWMLNPQSVGRDFFAFKVGETQLTNDNRRRGTVERTYARIPRRQIVPDTKYFTRPPLHDVKSGSNYGVCFDAARDKSWIFTSRKTISSIGGITLGTVPIDAAAEDLGTLPHDTFYMEDSAGSNLTNFCDGNLATLQSTLASTFATGFSNWAVVGTASGFTIKWTPGARNIKLATGPATVDINADLFSGSFEIRALKPAVASNDTQKPNQDPSVRTINATAHGGVVGDKVAFWQGDTLVATSVVMTAATDSFTVPLKDVDGKDLTLTHCGFSSDAALCVLNGPKSCSIQHITDFYLPGYTEGITTAADIPGQDPATDPINWLAAIIAGTTWVNVDDPSLEVYQCPILQYKFAQVQLADAVVTVTP